MNPSLPVFGAGLLAGTMNALAGGGSFVSLPVLIAVGVPSVQANASSTVGLFPGAARQMFRVGEETGTLETSLEQVADFLSEEMDYKVRNMIALMEPALIIAVGAAVGFVAVSVIMPMYGLLQAVK